MSYTPWQRFALFAVLLLIMVTLTVLARSAEARCRNNHCTWHGPRHHHIYSSRSKHGWRSFARHRRHVARRRHWHARLTVKAAPEPPERPNRSAKSDRLRVPESPPESLPDTLWSLPDAFGQSLMRRRFTGPWRLPDE